MANKKLKVGNVPNLRFPGFEGDWELKKLENIADKVNSGKTPLGGEAVYTKEGVLFIRSQNVNNDNLELENSTFIPESVNNQMKNSIVNPNDILLNITGASLGRSCVVPNDFKIGNVNQHVCIIRLNKQANPRFIQPIFSSSKGQTIFNSLQTGSGREGLNFESIKGIKLSIPIPDEQYKIASFLSFIDERISTQNKIIEDLKVLKTGTTKKIFSQELKFKDNNGSNFTGWEAKVLGELVEFRNGKAHEGDIDENGRYIVVNSKFISQNGNVKKYSNECIVPLYRDEIVMVMSDVPNGKALAKCFLIDQNDKYTLNQRICALVGINCYNPFLYYLINRNEYYLSFDSGVGQTNLKKDEVLNCPLIGSVSLTV